MKTFLATAAIVTALALPAFAEGEQPSDKAGEAKGNIKATTESKDDIAGSRAMGQGAVRSTTGTSATNQLNKQENSSPANPGQKTGVSGGSGGDGGSSGGSGGSSR